MSLVLIVINVGLLPNEHIYILQSSFYIWLNGMLLQAVDLICLLHLILSDCCILLNLSRTVYGICI